GIAMRARRERYFGIARMLLCHARTELVGNQFVISGRFKAARDVQVNLNEVVEVAILEPVLHLRNTMYRKIHAIALRQNQERRGLYGALEMHMQSRLRH